MQAKTEVGSALSYQERDAIADQLGVNRRYLYQLVTGRRELDPEGAVALEQRSGGKLKRWMLRRHSWHRIWPELIGTEGAPAVPAEAAAAEVAHG